MIEQPDKERWKDVVGYEGLYQVSNLGRVRSTQYHDYAELFKNWFGNDIEQKIVESAIVFWFKDADAKSENKLVNYFRED